RPRARRDAGAGAGPRQEDQGARQGAHRPGPARRVRARPAPRHRRHLRQRHSHPHAARHHRRRAHGRPGCPREGAGRRLNTGATSSASETLSRHSPSGSRILCPELETGTHMNTQELIQESQRWLDIISAKELTPEQKERISTDTVDNFNFYYNRGYLEYRKSVIEMRDNPALEWVGQGSTFEDLQGRTYIDCLGGYGIYSPGIRHPKVVKAVADQLARMPLSSQELLDPLRGALAELLGEITPGDLQYSFFINNGTDAVEGAIKLARIFTGKTNFISSPRGFHGKSCGSLSLLGRWEYREPFLPLLPGIHFVEFGDAEAVEDELYKADQTGKGIAAVIMEPIQGEAGA